MKPEITISRWAARWLLIMWPFMTGAAPGPAGAPVPSKNRVAADNQTLAQVCAYYGVDCAVFKPQELAALDLAPFRALLLGGGWDHDECRDKLFDFLKSGGIIIGLTHQGFSVDWLTNQMPIAFDNASYDSPLVLDKTHPLFNAPFCFSKSKFDFYEPNDPLLLGRTDLIGIHGGTCYGSFCNLGTNWIPLVQGGEWYHGVLPQHEGAHYSWVEGACGKGRVLLTSMAMGTALTENRGEAGLRMMANILKYAGFSPNIAQESRGEFAVKKTSEELTFVCKFSGQAPALDGRLDQACWQEANRRNRFVLLKGRGLATQQTEVHALFTEDALYLGFVCLENNLNAMKTAMQGKDVSIFTDDCVEIFCQPAGDKGYYHFGVSAGGARYDARGETDSWNGEWEACTGRNADGWIAEIRIPFKSLGVARPGAQTVWRMNFAREEKPSKENSTWAPTEHFHNPEAFGKMVFAE